ncbi:MAG: tRNA (N(6)-L-threonylcarbamoyladenosine(37)-C(2))-methylthiotransferase MtaB [Flavobacteriales bacterium]|nr:tRNA (N(6)-L-threonylcarbamoyladenosine(37)-C(2))-methylthiotransferase MtaB [Flavobacteriales bacterium]
MQPYRTVAFHTLGCKLNFSETSTLARQFQDAGYARVAEDERPDVLVLNTCSVTEEANKKCRYVVKRTLSRNPNTFVAVTGCYAQLKPEEITSIPGVRLVLGAGEKFNVVGHVEEIFGTDKVVSLTSQIRDVKDFIPSYSHGDRTRTFLKVQDGCNYFCAFCTIPLARGRSRSADISTTLQSAIEAIEKGAKEIVLTGVNIGDFGTSSSESLLDLCEKLDQLEGVERFRISSIEPNLLSDDLIAFVACSKKFMPHFHIPLQSGSDKILASMRRRYRTDLYQQKVLRIKELMPDACIGVDVITGFPGEGEIEFQETRNFIIELPVSYLHVFTYSERENTTALRLNDIVPIAVRQERNKILRMISDKKKRSFYESHMGKTLPVLWETQEDEGFLFGFTDNYIRVKTPYNASLVNKSQLVSLSTLNPEGVATCALVEDFEKALLH